VGVVSFCEMRKRADWCKVRSRCEAMGVRKASRRVIGENVSAALQRMSIVATEPLPTNAKLHIQIDEFHAKISMVECQG
jgi:hypothetical protein